MSHILTILLFVLTLRHSAKNHRKLVNVKETSRETMLCLAATHALVKLDDGTVVGDPMEKTTLDALEWNLAKGMLSPC